MLICLAMPPDLESLNTRWAAAQPAEPVPWSQTAVEQIGAIKAQLHGAALNAEELIGKFQGAKAALVQRQLDTLTLMGELIRSESGRYGAVE